MPLVIERGFMIANRSVTESLLRVADHCHGCHLSLLHLIYIAGEGNNGRALRTLLDVNRGVLTDATRGAVLLSKTTSVGLHPLCRMLFVALFGSYLTQYYLAFPTFRAVWPPRVHIDSFPVRRFFDSFLTCSVSS